MLDKNIALNKVFNVIHARFMFISIDRHAGTHKNKEIQWKFYF